MSDYTTEDYLYWLAHGKTAEERANAAWRVGRARDPRGVEALVAAATDAAAIVRVRVAEALATIHDPCVFAPLRLLLADEDADVRAMAALSLGNVGDREAVDALQHALTDAHAPLRANAAEALGMLGAHAATEALLRGFLEDDEAIVRHACRQSLIALGATDALLAVLPRYAQDVPVLLDVVETLGRMRDPRALDALSALREHADADVRAAVAWAMQQLGE